MSTTPLVVPMQLDAMVVNAAVQGAQSFRQWPFNYSALQNFDSPEPDAGQGQATFNPPPLGVYLHWTLPDAFRHGTHNDATDAVTYPLVPNRWLVVRTNGLNMNSATGWVIESDCPGDAPPDVPAALYLVDSTILQLWINSGDQMRSQPALTLQQAAASGTLPVATLGAASALANGWSERAATATFLTAVAPGNAVFSMYQPHDTNVFSFYDDLNGIDTATVSYLVVGWYSDPTVDILASWPANTSSTTPYADQLAALGWTVVGGSETQATTTLCQGMALGVPWDRAAATPLPSPITAMQNNVHVAIGNTTIDAFTALVSAQLQSAESGDAAFVDVLQAFQYGMLPVLEQVNGDELLALQVHQAAFDSRPGGYWWNIVPVSSDGSSSATLTTTEAAWLVQLNADQATYDEAVRTLLTLQWTLYAVWWKWSKGLAIPEPFRPSGFDANAYQQAVTTTIPAAIQQAQTAVSAVTGKVPQAIVQAGDTAQMSFERGIQAFAQLKALDASNALKAVAAPRLWRNGDPVVVLSGVEPTPLPDPTALLPCRLATHLVTGFTVGASPGTPVNATTIASVYPTLPDLDNLPAAIPALLAELILVDPTNAPAIAGAVHADQTAVAQVMQSPASPPYLGTLPALGLPTWQQQPWQALFMEWQVSYVPIPFTTNATPNWTFDGTDYHYTGPFGPFSSDTTAPSRPIGGIALLTPAAQFNFATQLENFLQTYVTNNANAPVQLSELGELYTEIANIDHWQFMSQALTGFGDLVAMRDGRAQRAPDTTIVQAVGSQTNGVPYIPNGPTYTFDGVRQGQFSVTSLLVYDKFGQVLQVVGGTGTTDPQNFKPILDPALVPDRAIVTTNPQRFAQLAPRVLQHARLDFLLVDATTDTEIVGQSPGANPVGGWILPNHVDQSLLLYAADGTALGEFRLLANDQGTRTAQWQPPPHVTMTLSDVATAAPRLAALISDPAIANPVAFQTFLDAIDSTLWTIDPLGNRADQNLSVLIGRPLALVRASLQLTLDGAPVADQSGWATTYPPPAPTFTGDTFAVRLGDQAMRQDGLIGYYTGSVTSTFNSVQLPDADVTQTYVTPIGPLGQMTGANYLPLQFAEGSIQYVTMLVDPRASVHAITGILPVKTVDIPPQFVEEPLGSLEVTFRLGPLITRIQPSPASGGTPPANPNAVALPYPAEQSGTWSWWEPSSAGWTAYDLLRAVPNAQLKNLPSTLRDGFLQLVINLDDT